jgi:hypothetical protein
MDVSVQKVVSGISQELITIVNECEARIFPVVATLYGSDFMYGWQPEDAGWLKGILSGGKDPLSEIRKHTVRAVIHVGLCMLGREMFRMHREEHAYVHHCQSPNALAYALSNGEFSDDEIGLINFDGEDSEKFKLLADGLPEMVLDILLGNANPETMASHPDHRHGCCEGGACDDPD